MIRINLLSVEKPIAATASRGPKFSLNLWDKAGPIAALFVLAGCAGYIALDYLNLQQQDAALHQELIAARAEKARLQPILREVERFEAQKRDLQQRVNLIEELRQNQVGPVHMLDQISRSMPDTPVAARHEADGQRRLARRQDQHAVVAGRLRRQPRGLGLLRQAGRDHEQRRREGQRHRSDQVHGEGDVRDARREEAGRSGPGRRRGAAPGAVAAAADFASKGPEQCQLGLNKLPWYGAVLIALGIGGAGMVSYHYLYAGFPKAVSEILPIGESDGTLRSSLSEKEMQLARERPPRAGAQHREEGLREPPPRRLPGQRRGAEGPGHRDHRAQVSFIPE